MGYTPRHMIPSEETAPEPIREPKISRRAFVVGGLTMAGALVVGGKLMSSPEGSAPEPDDPSIGGGESPVTTEGTTTTESTTTTTEATTTTTEARPEIQPVFPEILKVPNGAFLGAMALTHNWMKDSDRHTWTAEEHELVTKVDEYWDRKGWSRPEGNPTLVHRVMANTITDDGQSMATDENLAHGLVVWKNSTPNALVGAYHNVTQLPESGIDVTVDGQTPPYQPYMGIYGINGPGDILSFMYPHPTEPNHLSRFVYNWEGRVIFGANDQATFDGFFAEQPGKQTYVNTKCWEPGSAALRLADKWVLAESDVVTGTVAMTGNPTPPAKPNL